MSTTRRPTAGSISGPLRLDVGFRLSLLLDPDGTVRAVTEVSGLGELPPAAFLGQSITSIAERNGSGPGGAKRWKQRLAEAYDADGTLHFADRPPGVPDTETASIDSMLTPIRRANGTLDSILFVIEDRTEFQQTQRRLAESEQRFRMLAETLPQMVWTALPGNQVDYFSPRWAEFTGRGVDELLGQGYRDLVHPDDLEELEEARTPAQWSEPLEFRLRRHDGVYRTMESFIQPMTSEDGTLVRLVGATTDVTERRAAETRSLEYQEQLRTALAVTGLGRFTVELRPPALTGDERVADIMGTEPGQLLADADPEHLFDPIHPEDKERIRSAFAAALAGEQDFIQEYRISRPTTGGDEQRWVTVAGRVEFDSEGPRRMFGVIGDVTDRRLGEEARLRTQKRDAIGSLAGGIAHDFNNVIGAILSNAALAETELDQGVSPRTSIHEIRRGAGRAADLVRRLLAFSREDKQSRFPVDVGEVTREACALLRPTLGSNVTLKLDIDPEPAIVLGDATRLHQVVMNLVTNAGHAVGKTGGTVRVCVERVLVVAPRSGGDDGPTGNCVRLEVSDDGPGMPDEVQRRAFDPFFTTKPAGEGTGLGLAATQTIVRSCGGSIRIDSAIHSHTTMTVLLPASAEASQEPEQRDVRGVAPAPPTPVGGPPRVLFVDDEQPLVTLAQRAMPAYGCTATVFTDPAQALAAFTASPESFDALVTDLSMPGMTGLELAAGVRALRADLPVVLTSGFLTADNRHQAKHQGVDEIVAKPCSMDDLSAAVLRLVNQPAD